MENPRKIELGNLKVLENSKTLSKILKQFVREKNLTNCTQTF